jgi:uncharacterized protein with von Willebrand factor type A (vWA) domain
MDQRILEFIRLLRLAELPITTGETLEALRAATEIPLHRRSVFRDALRTTLVKRVEHHGEFERLFDLHFSSLEDVQLPGEADRAQAGGGASPIPPLDTVRERMGSSFSPMTSALMGGQGMAMEGMAMEAAGAVGLSQIQFPLQAGSYARRMGEHFDWDRVERELAAALETLAREGLPPEEIRRVAELLQANREAFQNLLRRFVRRELAKRSGPPREALVRDSLLGKSFTALSDHEIEEMRDVVKRLVQRLRTKIVLLERRRKRGRLDVRRTLRRNLQHGSVPMELVFRVKRRKRAQLMALCDVSSSVWNASRFMLNLLYAVQDQFARVRSFVFVSDLGEVTHLFSRHDTNEAIRRALKEANIRYHSYSDYGDVLLQFREELLQEVNTRTVVLIIGDGRNNYLPTRSWVLDEVRERAKKVIWLNPEPRSMWNTGDSAMHEYIPRCTSVEECRNLRQLAAFVDRLVM